MFDNKKIEILETKIQELENKINELTKLYNIEALYGAATTRTINKLYQKELMEAIQEILKEQKSQIQEQKEQNNTKKENQV